jgi:serine/threonine-protein kinase
MNSRNGDNAEAFRSARSRLAENVVKEHIRSFGFRVWADEGDAQLSVQKADFHIDG